MKRALLLVAVMAVSGCASKRPPPAPQPYVDLQAHYDTYFKCMVGRAYAVDDQQSDARTIGQAIQNDCPGEWGDYFRPFMTGRRISAEGSDRISRSVRAEAALNAVLTSRKLRQEASKPKPEPAGKAI